MTLTRRDFVKTGLAMTASAGTMVMAKAEETSMERSQHVRPNILLIHADQHRFDCLGAYGNSEIRTPNLDGLANDGVRFENSFCPYPVCTPSRYSLLCGQYVHEHRGSNNQSTLAPEIATFPRLLRDAGGYRTRAVGKMHFTPTYLDVGFEEMFLAEQDGPGRLDDDYHRDLMRHGLVDINDLEDQRQEYRKRARQKYWDTFGALPSNLPEEWHTTNWIGDRAVETLETWSDEANLLMVGFVKPHHPFDPPRPWCDAYNPDDLSLLPGWTTSCFEHDLALHRGYFPHAQLTEASLKRVMAGYYATIEQMDVQIGRLLDLLKRRGLYENTMIIYTSDHGEYMGFHHLLLKGNYLYDPLVKVPLIIKYPGALFSGNETKGAVSSNLVNNIDLAPTILARTGIPAPSSMHGNDLAKGGSGHGTIFCEFGRGDLLMARTRTHKLIHSREGRGSLFFDLEKDPLELENQLTAPEYADAIEIMKNALLSWRPPERVQEPWKDEDAPVILQPNVPSRDRSHRDTMLAYFEEQWDRYHAGESL